MVGVDPVPKTLYSHVFKIYDNGQSPENQQF